MWMYCWILEQNHSLRWSFLDNPGIERNTMVASCPTILEMYSKKDAELSDPQVLKK